MNTVNPTQTRQVARISPVLIQLAAALLIGGLLLYTVGFAHISHDAAHDTRHSVNFPCH